MQNAGVGREMNAVSCKIGSLFARQPVPIWGFFFQQALKLGSQAQAVLALSVQALARLSRVRAGQVLTLFCSINHLALLKTGR